MSKILELRKNKKKLVEDSRKVLDTAEEEERDLTDEEKENYDKVYGDISKIDERIERLEKQEAIEKNLKETNTEPTKNDPDPDPTNREDEKKQKAEFRMKSFRNLLLNGLNKLTAEEARALQADSSEAGGYTVAPEEFVAELIKGVDNEVFVRQFATKYSVPKAQKLGVPSLDADPADPTWTSELSVGSEDSTMDFGKRELEPHPLAQYIKVSNKLLRASVFNVDQLVRNRLSYKIGVVEENAFLNGSGAGQPLGIFTASSNGISTSRDVSTGNTSSSIQFDGLLEAKYTLKAQYWPKARWMFHRDAIKQISKLKDGEGQYIWQPSVVGGQPDRLSSFPIVVSEYVPNTFNTGEYVGALADFSKYWIVDALDVQIQVLKELYAANNQTGFISRLECDGLPTLEEAFIRVKLA